MSQFTKNLMSLLLIISTGACTGDGLSGQYSDPRGVTGYEFEPDGRVYISMMGTTTAATYDLEDDRVLIKGPDGIVVLRRRGEDLAGPLGLELTRVR